MSSSPTAAASRLETRLAGLHARMRSAALRAGRDPSGVQLVAVTKSAPATIFPLLAAAGQFDVGESRVQQLVARAGALPARIAGALRWHLVGHLQSNKARSAVACADVLHGIDSIALLERIELLAGELDRRPEVYLQVNVSGESAKRGVTPADLPDLVRAAGRLSRTRVAGLMTMAPADAPADRLRAVFGDLRRLRDELSALLPLPGLSMGMSDDFEPAIEEGATCIRVGRALVGDLLDDPPGAGDVGRTPPARDARALPSSEIP